MAIRHDIAELRKTWNGALRVLHHHMTIGVRIPGQSGAQAPLGSEDLDGLASIPRQVRYDRWMKRALAAFFSVLVTCSCASTDGSGGTSAASDAGAGADGAVTGSHDDGGTGTLADGGSRSDGGPTSLRLPPANAKFDYQLGGSYTPPSGVQVLSRDRNAAPAAGLYNICYVNGFQIQPDELSMWQSAHPDLILKDGNGKPIIDTNWNEALVDVSTPQKRADVAAIVGAWIDGCANAGYDAVEIDNLDSYSRSQGKLTADNCVAAIKLFADRAHARHLAIAQKNSSELVPRKAEMGTDFAVAEECNRYDECDAYRAGYGDTVFVIEYVKANFTTGCQKYPNLSIILRDLNLVTPTTSGYVYDAC